jgi:hypothetical protein
MEILRQPRGEDYKLDALEPAVGAAEPGQQLRMLSDWQPGKYRLQWLQLRLRMGQGVAAEMLVSDAPNRDRPAL